MLVCFRPSCAARNLGCPALSRASLLISAPPWRLVSPPPQGSSLGSGLFCPGPSSLNRPHPPHSQAHRDFNAWRLIRNAFAVRERLGDPRVVPGFRCPFLSDMPSSMTPGSSNIVIGPDADARHRPSPRSERLGTPVNPAIRFARGLYFGASRFAYATACQIARPPTSDRTRSPLPQRAFTSRLSASLVTLTAAGYDYNIDWTPMLAGLSPAGMAASLAAPNPDKR